MYPVYSPGIKIQARIRPRSLYGGQTMLTKKTIWDFFFDIFHPGKLTPPEQNLKDMGIWYKRRKDGLLVVNQSIDLSNRGLEQLPDLSTVVLNGVFIVSGNRLTTMKGSPYQVDGAVFANNNRLETMEGMPCLVRGGVDVSNNNLVTLEGSPIAMDLLLDISGNPIKSYRGMPEMIMGIEEGERHRKFGREINEEMKRDGFGDREHQYTQQLFRNGPDGLLEYWRRAAPKPGQNWLDVEPENVKCPLPASLQQPKA